LIHAYAVFAAFMEAKANAHDVNLSPAQQVAAVF